MPVPPNDAQSPRRAAFRGTQDVCPAGHYTSKRSGAPPGLARQMRPADQASPPSASGPHMPCLRPCHAAGVQKSHLPVSHPARQNIAVIIGTLRAAPSAGPAHAGTTCTPGYTQDGLQQLLAVHAVELPPVQQHQRIPAVAAMQYFPTFRPICKRASSLVKDIVRSSPAEVLLRQPVRLLSSRRLSRHFRKRCLAGSFPLRCDPFLASPGWPTHRGPVPGVGQQVDRRRSSPTTAAAMPTAGFYTAEAGGSRLTQIAGNADAVTARQGRCSSA